MFEEEEHADPVAENAVKTLNLEIFQILTVLVIQQVSVHAGIIG